MTSAYMHMLIMDDRYANKQREYHCGTCGKHKNSNSVPVCHGESMMKVVKK